MYPAVVRFYSRKDVQKKLVDFARDREVAVKYRDSFGRRDVLLFENDVLEFARQGATSFHVSVERWENPLELKTGMTRKQLDDMRIGWDLVLDLDSKHLEYAKIAAGLLIEALKLYSIEDIGVKFSGGNGFHIIIPFESFPKEINKREVNILFPEGPRIIASYLKDIISEQLGAELLDRYAIEDISRTIGKDRQELMANNRFNPFAIVDIDTVLMSSRHMLRAPYSFNEKKWLVSLPIRKTEILRFNPKSALPQNVTTDIDFMPKSVPDSSLLILQAFDFGVKQERHAVMKKSFEMPRIEIKASSFPPCIASGLNGLEDGRKRFLFIMINFLKSLGWRIEDITSIVTEWNKRNKEPLKEGYVISQLNWHKRSRTVLPPNCSNRAYYTGCLCNPDNLCRKIKNPVHYAIKKTRIQENLSRS